MDVSVILKGVIANLSILISSTYLLSKFSKDPINHEISLLHKIAQGIASGICGIILMAFSIPFSDHFLFDIRLVPIVMVSTSVGGIAPLIASVIIGISRFFFGVTPISTSVCITYMLIGVSQFFISKWVQPKKGKQRLLVIYLTVLIPLMAHYIFFSTSSNKLVYVLAFIVYSGVGTYFCYQFARDIAISKYNFIHYKNTSTRDHLTGISNRYSFDRQMIHTFFKNQEVTLLLLDINKFKYINDTYGHDCGDAVLIHFAKIIMKQKSVDEHIYRLGGDEFAIFIPKVLSNQEIARKSEELKALVYQNPVESSNQQKIYFQTSIGASNSAVCGTYTELYKAADDDLYQDKKSGLNGN